MALLSVQTVDALICGYLSRDAAAEDYESVRRCGAYLHGAALISKDLAGRLSVQQTDHMVREAAEAFSLLGFVVALAVPRRALTVTTVATVTGAGVGAALHQRSADVLKGRAAASIPIGGAGLIVVYPRSSAPRVERAVRRPITTAKGEVTGRHLHAVRAALAQAQEKAAATA